MGIRHTDDLDGSDAEPRTFGFDGKAYVIDLSPQNLHKLQKALQPFLTVATVYGELPPAPEVMLHQPAVTDVEPAQVAVAEPAASVARRATGRPRRRPAKTTARRGGGKRSIAAPNQTLRQWAMENGYEVSPKGRVPDVIVRAYEAANA
jgi:hypothetical protein